jgi:hypothetical protein
MHEFGHRSGDGPPLKSILRPPSPLGTASRSDSPSRKVRIAPRPNSKSPLSEGDSGAGPAGDESESLECVRTDPSTFKQARGLEPVLLESGLSQSSKRPLRKASYSSDDSSSSSSGPPEPTVYQAGMMRSLTMAFQSAGILPPKKYAAANVARTIFFNPARRTAIRFIVDARDFVTIHGFPRILSALHLLSSVQLPDNITLLTTVIFEPLQIDLGLLGNYGYELETSTKDLYESRLCHGVTIGELDQRMFRATLKHELNVHIRMVGELYKLHDACEGRIQFRTIDGDDSFSRAVDYGWLLHETVMQHRRMAVTMENSFCIFVVSAVTETQECTSIFQHLQRLSSRVFWAANLHDFTDLQTDLTVLYS